MDRIAQLEAQVETLSRKNETLEIEAAQARRAAEKMKIESHLRTAIMLDGRVTDEKAIEDIVHRALGSGEWKVDSQGRLIRQRDGVDDFDIQGDPITPRAWLKTLPAEAPHFFQDVPDAKPSAVTQNPWSAAHWNMTRQAEIFRDDPDLALRMAEAARSKFGSTRATAR